MSKRHLIIPDLQCEKGHPTRHIEWAAQAIDKYKPDVVICLGDVWEMASLSMYDAPGSVKMEGARIEDDIEAGNEAFRILNKSSHKCKKVLLRGNHEQRLNKAISRDARLAGVLGEHMFLSPGWQVVPYIGATPGQIEIDGVVYAHYFAQPNTGKPIGGTIQNRLQKIGQSFVQGHVQGLMQGAVQLATGRMIQGIQAGSFYLADCDYKGVHNRHWRGIVVLNEVRKGEFCEMPLSVDYLCREFEGMGVARFLQRNYKDAKSRFSLANRED